MRLRNMVTGSVVRVDDAKAARLAGDPNAWEPLDVPTVIQPTETEAPKRRGGRQAK